MPSLFLPIRITPLKAALIFVISGVYFEGSISDLEVIINVNHLMKNNFINFYLCPRLHHASKAYSCYVFPLY